MDPLAFYQVTSNALAHARAPQCDDARSTLIEALVYRYGPHTTADGPTVYRDKAEVEHWKERDPPSRFSAYLRRRDLLDDELEAKIQSAIETVSQAIAEAEAYNPDTESVLEHVFSVTACVTRGPTRIPPVTTRPPR